MEIIVFLFLFVLMIIPAVYWFVSSDTEKKVYEESLSHNKFFLELTERLKRAPLYAGPFYIGEGVQTASTAELSFSNGRFRLVEFHDGAKVAELSHRSIEWLGQDIRKHTIFTLSDFSERR